MKLQGVIKVLGLFVVFVSCGQEKYTPDTGNYLFGWGKDQMVEFINLRRESLHQPKLSRQELETMPEGLYWLNFDLSKGGIVAPTGKDLSTIIKDMR